MILQTMSNVGVVSEVLLSVSETPVSEAACISGADPGVSGAVVSMMMASIGVENAETFPALSVC